MYYSTNEMKSGFKIFVFGIFGLISGIMNAQDATITVNAITAKKAVSPYIYGRYNNFATSFGSTGATTAEINTAKEAGLRIARENGGNNATKYNWRYIVTGKQPSFREFSKVVP